MAVAESRSLTVRQAYDALAAFGRDAGLQPLLLLLHAAVPQSFRADLVNLLKQNFLAGESPAGAGDMTLDVDVLLSPLVQPAAAGYYRLDPEVRRHCVMLLDARYRHQSIRRSVEVAHFLLAYADALEQKASLALDPLLAEYLAIQRWVAQSFIDPTAAGADFASALAAAANGGADAAVASLRLGGVASALTIPLAGQAELLAYARGLGALQHGDHDEAEQLLGWMGSQQLTVGSVTLRPGRELLDTWRTRPGTARVAAQAPPRINLPPEFPSARFIHRPELDEVRAYVLDPTPTATTKGGTTADGPIVVRVIGDDGMGKWTLANRLVHDAQVLAAFPDGVVWLDEAGQGYPTEALGAYARAVGMTDLLNERPPVRIERFRELFASRRVLIVADQRTASDVVPSLYSSCGPGCTLLHLVNWEFRTDPARVVPPETVRRGRADAVGAARESTASDVVAGVAVLRASQPAAHQARGRRAVRRRGRARAADRIVAGRERIGDQRLARASTGGALTTGRGRGVASRSADAARATGHRDVGGQRHRGQARMARFRRRAGRWPDGATRPGGAIRAGARELR